MGGLELLKPLGLALGGLLAPLIVLYILKIKRKRRLVASTWLWSSAQRDLQARSPFRKLIPQVPLFLQALALILLALALSRPATRGEALLGEHVAVIIDVSASMQASLGTPDGRTRMDEARERASELIGGLAPGSQALVLAASREARVVAPLDRDKNRIKAALEGLSAEDVEGDLGAAAALAVDRLRQLGGDARIVVLTDGALAKPTALDTITLPTDVIVVGKPIANTAIIRVDVRAGVDPVTNEEQVQAFVLVANFGESQRDVYITMRQQNASDVLASRRQLLKPGEELPVVLTFQPTRGDYDTGLIFELSPHDALPADDIAYGRVPSGDKLPVMLAAPDGKPSLWLERALASDPKVELFRSTTKALSEASGVDAGAFIVVDRACPQDVPGGDLLIVNPPAGRCFGTVVGESVENPLLTSWDESDPRLRFLTLDGVAIAKASRLEPEGKSQELVRSQSGPVVTDISTASRYGTLVGFDVGDTDWPLKASFVLFVRNLVEQARAHRSHGIVGPAHTGEPLRAALPSDATEVEVVGPDGKPSTFAVREGLVVVPSVPMAGLVRISWQGRNAGTTVVPTNLASAAESDLARVIDPETIGGPVTVRAASDDVTSHVEWGWLLAALALAFVVFDVWYFTRTPRRTAVVAVPRAPDRKRAAGATS